MDINRLSQEYIATLNDCTKFVEHAHHKAELTFRGEKGLDADLSHPCSSNAAVDDIDSWHDVMRKSEILFF